MPKNTPERIIDTAGLRSNGSVVAIKATVAAPHILATTVGLGEQHSTYGLTEGMVLRATGSTTAAFAAIEDADLPSTIVRTSRTVTAGAGLTGGGALSGDITLDVGAGTLITVGVDSVGITAGANYQFIGTGSGTAAGWRNVSELAGAGLTAATGVLAVGAGTLVTVGADTVGITAGANYQFITTGAGTAAAWANVSTLAGAGLTAATGILAVGAGNGITVNADDVALTTPGTLTVSTTNSASGSHTHAITSSSNPGAAASLLASSASGYLQLVRLGIAMSPTYPLDVTGNARISGTLYADGAAEVDGNLTVGLGYATPGVLYVNASGTRVGINRDPDSQFDLDVAGAIRGQYLVGKHAIQLSSAIAVFHYDGPGPYNLDFSGTDFSHMGQPGTIAGGVIYRPGKFNKAAQLAGSTVNLVPNPRCGTNTNGWSVTAAGQTAIAQQTDSATVIGGTYGRTTCDGTAAFQGIYLRHTDSSTGIQGVTAGASHTFSAMIRTTASLSLTLLIQWYNNTTFLSQASTAVSTTSEWTRCKITATAHASANKCVIQIRLASAYGSSWTLDVGEAQMEQKAYATPYCDGALGTGHAWTGTAHASSSTRTRAQIAYSNIGVANGKPWTIGCWFYPFSDSGRTADYLFGGLSSDNKEIWVALSTSGGGGLSLYDGETASTRTLISSGMTWNAWNFVALASDGANVTCYLNNATGNTLALTLGLAAFKLRPYNASDTYDANALFDDTLILNYAADAKLLRAIYESDAPVFVESSVISFRSPSRAPIWVDEYGLWAQGVSGSAIFGLYGGDPRVPGTTKSWGGATLDEGDLLLGSSTAYVLWDASAATLAVKGAITADSGSIAGVLSIGASGGIYQGTGTFASPTTGLKIWNDSGLGRIGGYNTGVLQWYAGTDGKLYAGAGTVRMDSVGFSVWDGSDQYVLADTNGFFYAGNASGGGIEDPNASFVVYPTGDVWIGAGQQLLWDQSADTLYLNGDLSIASGGNIYAGAGNVTLDENGVTVATSTSFAATNGYGITQHSLKSSGLFGSYISALNIKYTALSTNSIGDTTPVEASSAVTYIYSIGKDDGGGLSGGQITLWARDYNSAGSLYTDAYLEIYASKVGADDYIKLISNDVYLAGTTNGIEVTPTGLACLGTAKYERHIQIPAALTGNPSNQPTSVDFGTAGGLQFATTGAKYAFCQWELPDDWDGADIYFEVDWMPDSGATSGTDAVRWTVEYRSIAEGETITNGTSVTLSNGAGGDTGDYSRYQTKHSRMTLAYNNANQPLTAQDHLYFKISRDTGVANDFGGTVTVTAFEIIYTSKGFPSN